MAALRACATPSPGPVSTPSCRTQLWHLSLARGPPADDTMATMVGMSVRRLAAIDMYGAQGTTRRRRIILAEFVAGVVALVAFGIWLAVSA